MKKIFSKTSVLFLATAMLFGCGGTSTGNPDSEDVSVTGSAVSAVGGALSSSGSNGTMALLKRPRLKNSFVESLMGIHFIPEAYASLFCPTFKTAEGAGCTASGGDLYLSYNDCFFNGSVAAWQGVLQLQLSTGALTCGSFPSSLSNAILYRQYVASSGSTAPSAATVTAHSITATLDDATSNLGNFDGATITPILNGGYGYAVGFSAAGTRSSLAFGHHESIANVFDHSLSANLTISPTSATSRTVTGDVYVYHNLLKVIGTAHFSGVVHTDSCCWPSEGSITTSFTAGTHPPTTAGAAAVGKQEIMTLTGCGTASLQSYDGTTKNITFSRCY